MWLPQVPVFPPGTRAKALLRRSVIPKLIERLFCRYVQEGDLRIIRLAFVAAGLCMAQGTPASAACVVLAGTADGFISSSTRPRTISARSPSVPCAQNRSLTGAAE